eukprot:GFKZ01014454.1.p4 GENE.GFKZ01014454.1~~GFKZ01014454.1.p4  ORF type:complete len:113 (+),score=5.16 GFKZ01014454.1:108-446(+)
MQHRSATAVPAAVRSPRTTLTLYRSRQAQSTITPVSDGVIRRSTNLSHASAPCSQLHSKTSATPTPPPATVSTSATAFPKRTQNSPINQITTITFPPPVLHRLSNPVLYTVC